MDDDDALNRGKPKNAPGVTPRDLTALSLDDLSGYIAELRAEIARAEADIAAKSRHRGSAEALFRR